MSYWVLVMVILADVSRGGAQKLGEICNGENGEVGTCVAVEECLPVYLLYINILAGFATDESSIKYNRSLCNNERHRNVVCCVGTTPSTTTTTTLASSKVDTTRRESTNRTQLLPESCPSPDLADRVISGEAAPLGSWPWMVLLRARRGNHKFWGCGGNLISDRYVLTAAHCFAKNIGVEFARIGENTLATDPDCMFNVCAPAPQDITVDDIIMHPEWDSPCQFCNDIALLRLSTKVILHTHYVMPICLPLNPEQDMGFSVQEFTGKYAWAAGWGTTERNPLVVRIPDVLQQVQLPIQDNRLADCAREKRLYDDPAMIICAGGVGKDTCRGDSGGPLTLTNKQGTIHFLIGLTSKGPLECGLPNTVGIYTSVHYYIPWIMENMRP